MLGSIFIAHLTGKSILRYTLMPQIGPRLKELIEGGFSNLSFLMALAYQAVKLLPANHPYLIPDNKGQYSVRDVLIEASNHLHFDLKHIDQIIVYFSLIAGVIILGVQFLLLIIAFLINPATAQSLMPEGYGEFFNTAAPSEDLALRLLDSVFGVPGIFGSKEATETPFHQALHTLFQFYSIGLLVLAGILVIYFIFVVLAETAQTGTPFGKRYNHVWAPIRLVVAIGLLVPISYGFNSGQWVALYAAKWGSGFATNGWLKFNETLSAENPISKDKLIGRPNIPELDDVAAFMMLVHTCKAAYAERNDDGSIKSSDKIKAYLINTNKVDEPSKEIPLSVIDALKYTQGGDFFIRFGEKGDEYAKYEGSVYPTCGDLVIPNQEPLPKLEGDAIDPETGSVGYYKLSPYGVISGRYYVMVYDMWSAASTEPAYEKMAEEAEKFALTNLISVPEIITFDLSTLKAEVLEEAKKHMEDGLDIALDQLEKELSNNEDLIKFGWGGAGIWYNKIAGVNGMIVNILMDKPQIRAYPDIMTYVCEENMQADQNIPAKDCYNPVLPFGKKIEYKEVSDGKRAIAFSDVYAYWYKDSVKTANNPIVDVINLLFGTQGLFDMCKNADVHPLAQLSTLGKGLVEAAIRNIGIGLGLGLASILPVVGPATGALSKMAMTFASIGILIGFMLYYLVPFMPFLYFLFAVGGWVKGLFEAMVGIPLWALAHIRIDGQGLPGDGAINGYLLIFEIFLRPILIVFGLIASVVIFGAMIKVLNEIFGIVVNNLSGNDPTGADTCFAGAGTPGEGGDVVSSFRGPVDEFFYTIVYAILVYMIGMASFKLIDLIPNNILRWMGQGVQTFNDQAGEPADGLMSKIAIGGGVLGQELQGVATSFGQGVSGTGTAAYAAFKEKE